MSVHLFSIRPACLWLLLLWLKYYQGGAILQVIFSLQGPYPRNTCSNFVVYFVVYP